MGLLFPLDHDVACSGGKEHPLDKARTETDTRKGLLVGIVGLDNDKGWKGEVTGRVAEMVELADIFK